MEIKKQNSLIISDLPVQMEELNNAELAQIAGGENNNGPSGVLRNDGKFTKGLQKNGFGVGGGRGPGDNDL